VKDTTTIVVAVGLVAGAIYLATREEKAADDGSADDGASGSFCASVGTLDKKAGAACGVASSVLSAVRSLSGSACSKRGGIQGTWSERDGFTGRCRRKGESFVLNYNGEGEQICCGLPGSDARCHDVRHGVALRGSCLDGFPRSTTAIRDHRSST
jgi:hypothetical protein